MSDYGEGWIYGDVPEGAPAFDWSGAQGNIDDSNTSASEITQQYQNYLDFYNNPANLDLINEAQAVVQNPTGMQVIEDAVKTLGNAAGSFIKNYLYDPQTKKFNIDGIATAATALKALQGGDKPQSNSYQGSIPNYTAVRKQVEYNDPNRVPGSAGRSYFTDTQYVTPGGVEAANTAAATQAQGILSGYRPAPSPSVNPYAGKFRMAYEPTPTTTPTGNVTTEPASGVAALMPPQFARGGVARYLQGQTDGMADKIPSSIDGKQKAALSHGEFVIPADVVSHLGNGNSDAGAKKLYEMMSRVRKARTGNPEQGKKINPDKFMPGGQVGFAAGGIAKFQGGGPAGTGVVTPTITSQGTSTAQGLSTWAGPMVSDYLGKGQALANTPYQGYKGPLTAGASDLQQQQFAGLSDVAKTGYTPTQFKGGIFDTNAAQAYMNPFLDVALNPQLEELRRQGQITNRANQAQATKMGAFGSSGSALSKTEGERNVLDKMQSALGQGYSTAYDKAMAQFNADQTRQMEADRNTEASRQYGANFGLTTLDKLGAAGTVQRDIEQQGLTADKKQFEEEREDPFQKVQFQKNLLAGLPITTTESTNMQGEIAKISDQIAGLTSLYRSLQGLGQASPTPTPTPTTVATPTPTR
jgi:hypothetical protein